MCTLRKFGRKLRKKIKKNAAFSFSFFLFISIPNRAQNFATEKNSFSSNSNNSRLFCFSFVFRLLASFFLLVHLLAGALTMKIIIEKNAGRGEEKEKRSITIRR